MLEAPFILLAEDSEDDSYFARRCFAAAGVTLEVRRYWNGQELCRALSSCGEKLPWAVVLDLKMPLMDGFEVLEWIRQQPAYAQLPVVILSSSGMEMDRARAEELGATEYLVKPNSLHELELLVKELVRRLAHQRVQGSSNSGRFSQ